MNKERIMRLGSIALAISFGVTVLISARSNPFDTTSKYPDKPTISQGVNKIYIVDESRCENPDSGKNAGRVYLIEGQGKTVQLMKAFNNWHPKEDEVGGCLCGGPDKLYYCYEGTEQVDVWGLDCDTFLNYHAISPELNGLLNPKYPTTFLGEPIGYALIGDVPLETTEKEIVDIGRKADVTLFYNEGSRKGTIWQKDKETASFEVLIKIDLRDKGIIDSRYKRITELLEQKASEEERAKVVQETNDKINAMWFKAYQEWLLNYGIELSSLIDTQRNGWSSNGWATLKLCLSKIPPSFKKSEQWQNAECNISIEEVITRTKKEKGRQYYYQIIILVPTSDSEKESKRVSAAMPMLKNVRCVCDRFLPRKEVTLQ